MSIGEILRGGERLAVEEQQPRIQRGPSLLFISPPCIKKLPFIWNSFLPTLFDAKPPTGATE